MCYGQSDLETGWFVVGGGDNGVPVDWSARELDDSLRDLEKLGRDVINQMEVRFNNSFSELNRLLSKCFDFARLFLGLCGVRSEDSIPVSSNMRGLIHPVYAHNCDV
jgi:hypothetical protein